MPFQGVGQDHVLGGLKPRRHHDAKWSVSQRAVTYSFLAEMDLEAPGPLQHKDLDTLNIGDDQAWALWRAVGDKRKISSFSMAFPAVTTGSSPMTALPLYRDGAQDDRFEDKRVALGMPTKQKLPKGWPGIVNAAMIETEQVDLFHPSWTNAFVAVNHPQGDPDLSTVCYDVLPSGELDPRINAPSHRLLAAFEATLNATPSPGKTVVRPKPFKGIALQLNVPGCKDKTRTNLPFIDHANGALGFGEHETGGGPFVVKTGARPCQHTLGKTHKGFPVHPLHLAAGERTGALWSAPGGKDAPFKFDQGPWMSVQDIPTGVTVFQTETLKLTQSITGLWVETLLRYDSEETHFAAGLSRPGLWKWQTRVPLTVISLEELGGDDDPPPPWEPEEGGGDPPKEREKAGGGRRRPAGGTSEGSDGITTGSPLPGEPVETFPEDGDFIEGGASEPAFPEEEAIDLGDGGTDLEDRLREAVEDSLGLGDDKVSKAAADELRAALDDAKPVSIGPRNNQRKGTPKEIAFGSHCARFPCIGLYSLATDEKALAVGSVAVPTDELKKFLAVTPQTAKLVSAAKGGAGVGQQDYILMDGARHATESVLAVLPTAVDPIDTFGGKYDPCGNGETAPAIVHMTLPPGLATLNFASPQQNRTSTTSQGYRIYGDTSACPPKLRVHPVDANGDVDTTVGLLLDGSSVDVKGTLKNNGSTVTSGGSATIGGDGSDGATTYSADTSISAVVNATSLTVDATYSIYPALSKPLILKASGSMTLNGELLAAQRSYMEPS